jgi:CcmD family protein
MDERNFAYLFFGLAAVWVCLAAYAISLAARQSRIRQQLDALKKLIEARGEES